jgi:hypothetical protein
MRSEAPRRPTHGAATGAGRVVFEYTGPTSLVAKGGVTGRGYAFRGYGSRVTVDARDARSLAAVPYLQQVLRRA